MQRKRRLATAWSLMGSGALALVGGGALALPGLIHAAPSYVVSNCTTSNTNGVGKAPVAGDLEYAVEQADVTPGTITFDCAAGSTIAVMNMLNVVNTMTINGLSTDKKTPVNLDGGSGVQLFDASASGMVFTLENLTLQNASGPTTGASLGGAVVLGAGTLDVTNDTFSHNTVQATDNPAAGSAIFDGYGTLNITNSTFTDNTATESNTAGTGNITLGAVASYSADAITITGSRFTGNTATSSLSATGYDFTLGGAVGDLSAGNLLISSSTFEDNSATATSAAGANGAAVSAGGAVFDANFANTSTLTIQSGSLFEQNAVAATGDTASATGGAVQAGFPIGGAVAQSMTTLDSSSLLGNTASATITGDNGFFSGSAFYPNAAGAGLDDLGGGLAVTLSTIANNSATTTLAKSATATAAISYGGGLVAEAFPATTPALATLDDSTISGNTASEPLAGTAGGAPSGALGGGIMDILDNLIITRATIAKNAASGTTSSYGGGLVSDATTLTLGATILAENTAANGPGCDVSGTETDLGYNLESGTDCFGKTPATGDKQNVSNPGLASKLANNGGPTETLALLAGSPAIDAIPDPTKVTVTVKGSTTTYNLCPGSPASDQRSVARPQGAGCDIGAYEYQTPVPSTGLSGNGTPHDLITAQTTTHQGTAPTLPQQPPQVTLPKLPRLPNLTPQQPVVGTVVAHSSQAGVPLWLATLVTVLGFALLGSGALVLGRTRKVDGR